MSFDNKVSRKIDHLNSFLVSHLHQLVKQNKLLTDSNRLESWDSKLESLENIRDEIERQFRNEQ